MPTTFIWKQNTCPPVGYDNIIKEENANREITIQEIDSFITSHPIVDGEKGSAKKYVKKFIDGDVEDKPEKTEFWYWLRHFSGYNNSFKFHEDGRLILRYDYNYYTLWKECMQWEEWRKIKLKELKYFEQKGLKTDNGNNGYWCHAIRLLGRLQWFTLKGEDNWTNPNGKPRKRKRQTNEPDAQLSASPKAALPEVLPNTSPPLFNAEPLPQIGSRQSNCGYIYCFNTVGNDTIYKAGKTARYTYEERLVEYVGANQPNVIVALLYVENVADAETKMINLLRNSGVLRRYKEVRGKEWFKATDNNIVNRHVTISNIFALVARG